MFLQGQLKAKPSKLHSSQGTTNVGNEVSVYTQPWQQVQGLSFDTYKNPSSTLGFWDVLR